MKASAILIFFVAAGIQTQPDRYEFLSWYDGWGTHTVLGTGKVAGGYQGTVISCGNVKVPVRAAYDTHFRVGREPTDAQSDSRIHSSNEATLQALKANGLDCDLPKPEAEA